MKHHSLRIRYADVAATLALVLALSGTAYAVVALPRNSVGTKQIKPDAVTAGKIRDAVAAPQLRSNAVTSTKVLNRSIGRADLHDDAVGPPQIAAGAVGASELGDGSVTTVKIGAGQITEGHLFPGAVGSTAVADESLTLTDIAGAQGTLTPAGFTLAPGECAFFPNRPAPGAQTGQAVIVGWIDPPPEGALLTAWISSPDAVSIRFCNAYDVNVSFNGQDVRYVTLG